MRDWKKNPKRCVILCIPDGVNTLIYDNPENATKCIRIMSDDLADKYKTPECACIMHVDIIDLLNKE